MIRLNDWLASGLVARWETGKNRARGPNLKALRELQKKAEEKTK
jgi:DNA-binding transcriptional regulator YiaG